MAERSPLSTLRVIWLAIAGAVLVFGVVAALAGRDRPDNPELVHWIGIFLAVSAGIQILTAVLLKQLIAGVSGGRYLVYCILRWALVEAVAIYGLVLKLLGASWLWAGAFLGLGLLLHLSMPPTVAEEAGFADDLE